MMTNVVQLATTMKLFLALVQPLPIKYGYPRGIKQGEAFITYQQMGTTLMKGIGNAIIGERVTYLVTVQTKTAEQNMSLSQLIRRGTHKTVVEYVSDDPRKDVTVKDGWINSIILHLYTSPTTQEVKLSAARVREELQKIADAYIFSTSSYASTLSQSFIDSFVVPPLPKKSYTLLEFLQLKQEYVDKLFLTTMQF